MMPETEEQSKAMKKVSINCPEDLWETVSIKAVKARTTVQEMFLEAMREYLKIKAA